MPVDIKMLLCAPRIVHILGAVHLPTAGNIMVPVKLLWASSAQVQANVHSDCGFTTGHLYYHAR
ncbi:hypothetical protein NG798_25285 [Ancylothrix sp. C2]|nr:hypothetical protein [Ancylothrix sp. D3o]